MRTTMTKQGLSYNRSTLIYSTLLDLLLLTTILALFYTAWMGSYALFTPDEGRYSEVAREMTVTGDYLTPRLNGIAFFDKPILYYWLQAAAIKMFGIHESSLRAFPVLAGILGCLITYLAGRVLFNRRTGILSAIILATCTLYFGASHYANLDLEVAVFISCSLMLFSMGMKFATSTHASRFLSTLCLWSAYAFAGLAVLTKGAIGILFPTLIITSWIIILGRWDTILKMRLVSGLFIFAAVTLPWYILVQQANPEFFHFFFVTQQLTRYLSAADFNNKSYVWFYAPLVLTGFLPWSVFLLQAMGKNIAAIWRNRQNHDAELFLVLWSVIIFVFFSIPRSKTIGYILPILPALALLVGHYIANAWDQAQRKDIQWGLIIYIIVALFLAMGFVAVPYLQLMETQVGLAKNLYFTAAIFLGSALVIIPFLRQKKFLPIFSIFTASTTLFLLNLILSAAIINTKTIKPIALELKPLLKAEDEVIAFYKYQQDLPLYLEKYVHVVADWQSKDIPAHDNWVREFWFGMDFKNSQAGKHRLLDEKTFWQQHWFSDKHVYVILDQDQFKSFIAKAKKQHYLFEKHGRLVVLSNKPTLALM